MFPPEKSGLEIEGFEIFHFPLSLCRDPGKCLYISKDFSGTDIYHFDIINALALRYCKLKAFLLTKNYFSKFAKRFKTKCFKSKSNQIFIILAALRRSV